MGGGQYYPRIATLWSACRPREATSCHTGDVTGTHGDVRSKLTPKGSTIVSYEIKGCIKIIINT